MKRIIAYYMHEQELGMIQNILQNQQKTDSYIIGSVKDEEIARLRSEGIIVRVLDDITEFTSPGDNDIQSITRRLPLQNVSEGFLNINKGRFRNFEKEGILPEFPAYYIIALDAPLIDPYKAELEALGVTINRYLGNNAYIVRLSGNVIANLQDLPYIRMVKYFDASDTGVNVLFDQFNIQPKGNFFPPSRLILFDILLHRKEDKQKLLNWLEEHRFAIVGSSPLKIRIQVNTRNQDIGFVAANVWVESIEEYIPPHIMNDLSRVALQIDRFNSTNPVLQVDYEGDGVLVGIADTGIDDAHPAFAGQIQDKKAWGRPPTDTSDPTGHGTHVAGSIVGNGAASNGQIKGTAPKAKIFFQSVLKSDGKLDIPVDLGVLFEEAYVAGARIHNNSWGAATKSRYTASSVEVDDFVYTHKDMLIVFSAGNDGKALQNRNVPKGITDLLSLGSPATAKNALTVGASRSNRTKGGYSKLTYGVVWQESFPDDPTKGEKVSGNSECLAAFSSRGPVDDERRIKPDLVAPGTDIASAFSKDADLSNFCGIHPLYDDYAIMCGTSMSAPLVAGCAALVREYYQKTRLHSPSAALLKATLINGTRMLTGDDANQVLLRNHDGSTTPANVPHFHQGFGLLDILRSIPGTNAPFKLEFRDTYLDPAYQVTSNGQKFRFDLHLTTPGWLRICLVYTDPPGRGLQHNLILVADLASQRKKWAGNSFLPKYLQVVDPATNLEIDLHNNVQTICIDEAEAGLYSVQVMAHNVWKFPQDFAIVITSNDINFSFTNY